jgi:uncharacterized protein (DUF924 family)
MRPEESLILLAAIWSGYDHVHFGCEPKRGVPSKTVTPPPAPLAAEAASDPKVHGKAVVDFWREAGPTLWFAKDPVFDQRFREKFSSLYEAAAGGKLAHWLQQAESALALILLLDQYPRNSFRGTPRMYATDALARQMTSAAIAAGHDLAIEVPLRLFVYLPYGHSEDLADQERSVELSQNVNAHSVERAKHHRDIVRRFGRFPHRNAILGRQSRPEELRYLAEGGYAG